MDGYKRKDVSAIKALGMTANDAVILYGGEKDGKSYAYNLADDARLPEVPNG